MDLFCRGILMGLVLAAMAGPILFTLMQTSLDHGFKKGFLVGLGVWSSDILFIVLIFNALKYLNLVIKNESFHFYTGLIGGMILVSVGLAMLIASRQIKKLKDNPETKVRKLNYFTAWTKGFLINTVNPFTIVFWAGIISTELGSDEIKFSLLAPFFIGLIGTLVITDTAKVAMAHKLRKFLTPERISMMRNISGLALIIFGVALMVRVSYWGVL